MRIGVPAETASHERRVALVPDGVQKLIKAGHAITVQRGAGTAAGFPDVLYEAAGATLAPDAAATVRDAELVCRVQRPTLEEARLLPEGSALVAMLTPHTAGELVALLDERRVTAFALEKVPRITRAQSMDVLSSQATVAGYKAVLLAASAASKLLPMLTTAAGSIPPSKAFILGAGVAGLQAIATARRLGAVVTAFDIRPAAAEQVQSLGASFVGGELLSREAETKGGYAKEQSQDQQARTLELIGGVLPDMDLVITTAQIPGKPAPRLITTEMVARMKPGSVIVDLASESGGNCEATVMGESREVHGVTVMGPVNLPSSVPLHASMMFSRNVETFVKHVTKEGALHIDLADEITGAMAITSAAAPSSMPA